MLLPIIVVAIVLSRIESAVATRYCSTPKDPENGEVFYTTLHVGSEISFECDNGYHLQDTEPVYCTWGGKWSKTDVQCVAKTCDPPEQLKNGQVSFTSLTFRSKLKFKCDDGYFLKADGPVFCTSDGTWTKTDVQCVGKTCDQPEHPNNGQVVYDSLNFGSQLTFKCDDGYLLNTNLPVFCMSDGTWNRTDIRCVEECSVPWIWNGHIEEPQTIYNDRRIFYEKVPVGSVRTEGSTLYLVCQNDHLVIGLGVTRTSISCFKGKWTPDPVCLKKDCSVPWISNGIIAEEIILSNNRFDRRFFPHEDDDMYRQVPVRSIPSAHTTLLLICQENNLVLGLDVNKTKIICSEGKWTPPPVCLKRSCRIPFIPNGRMERLIKIRSSSESRYQFKEIPVGRRAEDGEIFFFLCDQNYTPEDSTSEDPSRVICRDGEWSTGLRCKPCRRIVATVTSESPVESASTSDKEERLPNATQIPPTTPKPTQEICSCTYNSHDRKLSAVVNGVVLRFGDKVKKGDIATLFCQNQEHKLVLPNGISSSGSFTLICDVCQKWEDSDLPSCEVVRSDIICRDLKGSNLMRITYTNKRKVGSFAIFQCLAPGIRSGVSQTRCLENGEWQDSSPTCIAPTCPSASLSEVIPQNVIYDEDDVTSSTMPYNSTVKLMCRGFENLVGNSFARCGSEGKWKVGDIRCILGCPPFEIAPGSRLLIKPKKDVYKSGESVILSCMPGYELSTDLERVMCLPNGWSEGALPECIKSNVSDE